MGAVGMLAWWVLAPPLPLFLIRAIHHPALYFCLSLRRVSRINAVPLSLVPARALVLMHARRRGLILPRPPHAHMCLGTYARLHTLAHLGLLWWPPAPARGRSAAECGR